MAGNGDMTYRKRCACGWVSPSLYVFGTLGCPRGRAYALPVRAHPSRGPDGGLLAAGRGQP